MDAHGRPRRRRRGFAMLLMLALVGGIAFLAFRQGLIPARYTPLPVLDLEKPWSALVDWQIAEVRLDRELCKRVLNPVLVKSSPVTDQPLKDGCGWLNAVRLSAIGGATLPIDKLTCEMAAALGLWIINDVQPLAERLLGSRVVSIQHMGGYACRNILGSKYLGNFRSQHATANAIDISGFRLADGRTITLLKDWKGEKPEALFLRALHQRACGYFRVALSPNYNEAHRDHFHFDRGLFTRCY